MFNIVYSNTKKLIRRILVNPFLNLLSKIMAQDFGGTFVCLQCGRPGFDPRVGKIPWRRKWQPTLVPLPGKADGQRSLVGYSPWGRKELDMTEQLHFTSLQIQDSKQNIST